MAFDVGRLEAAHQLSCVLAGLVIAGTKLADALLILLATIALVNAWLVFGLRVTAREEQDHGEQNQMFHIGPRWFAPA